MSDDPQILSKRLAAYVKRRGTAKDLSLLINCDQRTAENIRAGRSWPIARHWLSLWLAFGDDLIEAVFHPERAAKRLEREVAELARQLAEKQAALQLADEEARTFAPRRSPARARHENRAAGVAAREAAR